jgi:hypothetical protein
MKKGAIEPADQLIALGILFPVSDPLRVQPALNLALIVDRRGRQDMGKSSTGLEQSNLSTVVGFENAIQHSIEFSMIRLL